MTFRSNSNWLAAAKACCTWQQSIAAAKRLCVDDDIKSATSVDDLTRHVTPTHVVAPAAGLHQETPLQQCGRAERSHARGNIGARVCRLCRSQRRCVCMLMMVRRKNLVVADCAHVVVRQHHSPARLVLPGSVFGRSVPVRCGRSGRSGRSAVGGRPSVFLTFSASTRRLARVICALRRDRRSADAGRAF